MNFTEFSQQFIVLYSVEWADLEVRLFKQVKSKFFIIK